MSRTRSDRRSTTTWLRILLPAALLIAWLAIMAAGGPLFGRISEVSTNEQTSFLPATAESTLVQEQLGEFLGDDETPAVVIAAADSALTDAQTAEIEALGAELAEVDAVLQVSPAIPSDDGLAVQLVALLDASGTAPAVDETVEALRATIADADIAGVAVKVTGPAGFSADIVEAFSGIDGILLLVALAAVFVILILVYRSPLLPVLVLGTSVAALSGER